MKITLKASIDLDAALEAVKEAALDALEGADPGGIYGIGSDGASEYEVTSWEVALGDDGSVVIEAEAERLQGKFAGKDEVEAELLAALEGVAITTDVALEIG